MFCKFSMCHVVVTMIFELLKMQRENPNHPLTAFIAKTFVRRLTAGYCFFALCGILVMFFVPTGSLCLRFISSTDTTAQAGDASGGGGDI